MASPRHLDGLALSTKEEEDLIWEGKMEKQASAGGKKRRKARAKKKKSTGQ